MVVILIICLTYMEILKILKSHWFKILASLAEETDEEATEPAVESPIVTDSSISRNSTPAFQGQTQEEVDIDLLIHGVKLPVSIKFQPLSLFCRKPAGLHLGVHVWWKSGFKQVKMAFTGKGLNCSHNFIEHQVILRYFKTPGLVASWSPWMFLIYV